MTSYNKEAYLPFVLKSLLAQEGDFEREYIVVDDGSTDRSHEIAMDLVGGLPNGRVLRQANAGPSIAQNNGARAATMPFLKLVDGDALIPPDAISRLMPAFARPDVALVNGGGVEISDLAADLRITRNEPPRFRYLADGLLAVIRSATACSSGALVRREAYLAAGGCDESVFVQDRGFVLRLARRHTLAFTDDIVVHIPVEDFRRKVGGHLNDNTRQIEHDTNAVLYGLARDFPDLPPAARRLAFRRAAGRAWRWARRIEGAQPGLDPAFWLNLLSYAPWHPAILTETLLRLSLEPYRRSGNLRRPAVG